MEPQRYVFQKLEKEKKIVTKSLSEVFLHCNRVLQKLCVAKNKQKDFCKVAISLQKERNNSGMAVEVMVVKCGKYP